MLAATARIFRAKHAKNPRRRRAGEGSRTPDLAITNRLLYQLSYPGG